MSIEFFLFAFVGFIAQIVDGALGMAYGVISSSVLLSFGVAPSVASASTHGAEFFTTAASAASHIANRNVNWRLFYKLAAAGIVGGVVGTYVLTSFDGGVMRPFICAYLGGVGVYILYRAFFRPSQYRPHRSPEIVGLGVTGGFADAVGGGGWGPVVTSGLIGAGGAPREVIGTVNAAEFFLTAAVSAAFLAALLTGHWQEASSLSEHLVSIAGLIVGGIIAAPLAGTIVRFVPARALMFTVGGLVLLLAVYQAWRLIA